MQNLLVNRSKIKVFETYNEEYGSTVLSLCPLLEKFQINIVNPCDSLYFKDEPYNDIDAFAFYVNKDGADFTSTYAEIVVNPKVCSRLGLSEQELKAGIAHEIGHIIMFFREDKEKYVGQGLEVSCDIYACQMGLAKPLSSLLSKMIDSGLYTEIQSHVMQNRIRFIRAYAD